MPWMEPHSQQIHTEGLSAWSLSGALPIQLLKHPVSEQLLRLAVMNAVRNLPKRTGHTEERQRDTEMQVMTSKYNPSVWNKALIFPIFKKWRLVEPDNSRGIPVNSNLSKFFCSILNSRFLTYLIDHHPAKGQIDLLHNHPTSDHICTLQAHIQNHVYKKGKTFACFSRTKKRLLIQFGTMLYFYNS